MDQKIQPLIILISIEPEVYQYSRQK